MRGRITENGATGDCDEMDLDANGASVPGSPGCFDSALSTPDVQKPRSDCETLKTLENVSLEPVGPSQGGEGFPYAPGEWPNTGDKWKWKVGRRRTASGFWADRYLILPKTLQRGKKQAWFTSKSAVEKYLKKSFPDADHQTFFASFQWQIPCTPLSLASAEDNNEGVIAYDVKRMREPDSICDGQTPVKIHCKAGNAKCRLETGKGKFFNALDCDICCVESGFCRECSCILCGKSIDQELGEYYFVQCEGNQGEDVICGHVAHLECAVICQTAGVVRSIGLDVEYYCRRCDKKTDLLKHVLGLIPTPELSKTGADFESNLNLALRLVQGTQQLGARILENLFQKAVKKLQSGMQLQDIFGDLRYSSVTVNADMERWRRKYLPNMDTISSDTEKDTPPDSIKELEEIILNMHYAHTTQLEAMQLAHAKQIEAMNLQLDIMETRLAEDEAYMEYPNPHEVELDSEKEFEGVHEEIPDEPIDESVIYLDEVKELEFGTIEYLDDSNSHPPPDEPIILKDNFEILEENSMMVPVMCSSSVFQPEDKLIQNYVELEGNFSLFMSDHYDNWLASHLDSHEQQSIQILQGLSYSSVWLKGRRMMVLGWFFLIKSSKLIKLGKGSSVSHPGLGLFRQLQHRFTHCMGGCNVSLTFPCILMLYYFDSLCQYVLRFFFK